MRMHDMYYDRRGNPITLEQWVALLEDYETRRVALTSVGAIEISTVWLGLDHNYGQSGPPLIFETMVFGGPMDQEPYRWATEAEALAGHELAVAAVRLNQKEG